MSKHCKVLTRITGISNYLIIIGSDSICSLYSAFLLEASSTTQIAWSCHSSRPFSLLRLCTHSLTSNQALFSLGKTEGYLLSLIFEYLGGRICLWLSVSPRTKNSVSHRVGPQYILAKSQMMEECLPHHCFMERSALQPDVCQRLEGLSVPLTF